MAVDDRPRIFNIKAYGAKGNGKRIQDAVFNGTTTVTSATAAFTSADVGKAIRLWNAGASSKDLLTTIASVTNATTIVLSAATTASGSAQTIIYGTDDTAAIQAAINAADTAGGGLIWVPQGVFIIAGALQTSISGTNPNCQIYIPPSETSDSTVTFRKHFYIRGEVKPHFTPMTFGTTFFPSLTASVIYSLLNGSGNAPAVFGTKSPDAGTNNMSLNYVTFEDLTVLTPQDVNNGGSTIGGINMWYSSSCIVETVVVSTDGNIGRSTQPTNEVAGIILSRNLAEIVSRAVNSTSTNYKYGWVHSDNAVLINAQALLCQYGFVFPACVESSHAIDIACMWCNHVIYCPTGTILGYIPSGVHNFKIDYLHTELFSGSGNWYDYVDIISDGSNFGTAEIWYTQIQSVSAAINNLSLNKVGGTGIICRQVGQTNIKLGTDVATNYALMAQFSDLTGGGARFPAILLQNTSASSPGALQYNIALLTLSAGNAAIIGQIISNYGSGATAPFTVQGLIIATRTADPIIFAPNNTEAFRIDNSGNFTFKIGKFGITEGSNGRVGQVTLVAGTKAITITGLTTSSRAFVTLVSPNTASLTIQYQAVCTSNTLTIQANIGAGTINNVDVSTLNYFVIN